MGEIEAPGVDEHHVHKAVGSQFEAEDSGQLVEDIGGQRQDSGADRRFLIERLAEAALEVDPAEEVLIGNGRRAQLRVGTHVLDIGLDEGSVLLDDLGEESLAIGSTAKKGCLLGSKNRECCRRGRGLVAEESVEG